MVISHVRLTKNKEREKDQENHQHVYIYSSHKAPKDHSITLSVKIYSATHEWIKCEPYKSVGQLVELQRAEHTKPR